MKPQKLNTDLLRRVKLAFVPQPGGAPMDPAMAGGMPPPGMDPAAMGGAPMDPAMAGGMPPPGMDPAAMGGAPMDPAMAGGMPPPGMDPAMAGMLGGAPMPPPLDSAPAGSQQGGSMITMTTDEFMKFIKQLVALIKGVDSDRAANAPAIADNSKNDLTEVSAKLDALLNSLN
jgi:hypothetical protein